MGCLLVILLQFLAGLFDYLRLGIPFTKLFMEETGLGINILVLILLWMVLVKFYKQSQFDRILKMVILILIAIFLLSIPGIIHFGQLIIKAIAILTIVNLVLYFVFIFRIMEIEKTKIPHIDYLKNYSLAFVVCLSARLIIGFISDFYMISHGTLANEVDLGYVIHLLILIPFIYMGVFFFKTSK